MMTSAAVQPRVRCREIGEGDLDSVIGVLQRGFAGRARHYWQRGLERQGRRALPAHLPRYGYMLENGGIAVGVILLLFAEIGTGSDATLRCNVSSWYVDPAFRSHASLLIFFAMKRKDVTYLNVSPARHTWPVIEAQGFRRYAAGQFISVPALNGAVSGCRIHQIRHLAAQRFESMPDLRLLVDHAAMGCLSLVVEASDGLYPFVFLPVRMRAGRVPLPMRQIVYCRSLADYVRFAGPIGRWLLRRGVPFVVHDANGPESGLQGLFRAIMGPKYVRGPVAPRLGDLAYTERVLFGS